MEKDSVKTTNYRKYKCTIARVKILNGVKDIIRDSKTDYYFFCLFNRVSVDDYVLLDVKNGRSFAVGKVMELYDQKPENIEILMTSFICGKIAVKNFEDICASIKNKKYRISTAKELREKNNSDEL